MRHTSRPAPSRPPARAASIGGLAGVLATAMLCGCAAPPLAATNVVFDEDVRDCAWRAGEVLGAIDVAIVLDTSQSTGRPAGIDLDGDGVVQDTDFDRGRVRGDSRLAAQVEAARTLVRRSAGEDVRFSIVTYSGPGTTHTAGRTNLVGSGRDSSVLVPLTSDRAALDAALEALLAEGADGTTIFYAGMRRATRELTLDVERDDRWRRKLVLLISDSPEPTGLASDGKSMNVDWRMKHAAVKARRQGVVIHTFGLSPDSPEWRRRPLGRIAGATGGDYHPVEDPRRLACHLTTSIQPTRRAVQRMRAYAESAESAEESPPDERVAAVEDGESLP